MKGFPPIYPLLAICLLLLSGCGPGKDKENTITIATAANMQFAMEALTEAFSEESGIDCDLVVSSSGTLMAQIINGAPYDVFVSADMKYPGEIAAKGFAQDPPSVYAHGKLVLWTLESELKPSIASLSEEGIDDIALANPKTAPYGRAAMEVLRHHKLDQDLEDKLVYGESISQVNHFVSSGASKLGFTAKSVVLSPKMKGKGKWMEIDPGTYSPIEQGVVVVKGENGAKKGAIVFRDFLFSEKARTILKDYGYSVDE